jgi:Uma2 family endonuclease
MTVKTLTTAEEFLELATSSSTELVRGEVVEMGSPGARHGFVCVRVAVILSRWADHLRAGYVLGNDSGIVTERDPDTVRGADCQFVSADRLPQGLPARGYPHVPPDLAVEVIPENDLWPEITAKVAEYLRAGVQEVWIVAPETEGVQVYRADRHPARFDRASELASEVLPGFQSPVSAFFSQN